MAYGIFESTNLSRNYSMISTSAMENGWVVHKGDLVTGSKDIYNAVVPTGASINDTPVFVIGNPAWNYDTSSIINQNEEEYLNVPNKAFRTYELEVNKKFTIADYGIDNATGVDLEEGHFVGLQANTGKLIATVTAPTTAYVGKIVRIRNLGNIYHVGQTVDQRMRKVTIETIKNG